MDNFPSLDILEKPPIHFWSIGNPKLSLKAFTTGLFALQWSEVSGIFEPSFLETAFLDIRLFLKKRLIGLV